MTVAWSERADRDFRPQARWLAANRGRPVATRYLEEVMAAVEKLERSELVAYQAVPNRPGMHRLRVNQHLDLYYRLETERVMLLAFFDTRQDPDKLKI